MIVVRKMTESVQKPLGQWQREGQGQDMAKEESPLTKKINDFAKNILGVTQAHVDRFSIATPHERNLAMKELRFNTSLFRKGWVKGEEGKYFAVLDEFVRILNFIDNELGFEDTSGPGKADASKGISWSRNSGIPVEPNPLTNECPDDVEPSHLEAFFLETGGHIRSRMIHSIDLDTQYHAVLLTTPGSTSKENTSAASIGILKPEPMTKPVTQVTEDNVTSLDALKSPTASAMTEEELDFQVRANEGIAASIDSKALQSPSSINESHIRTLPPVQPKSGRKMSNGAAEFWQRLNRRVANCPNQAHTMPMLSLSKSQGIWNCPSRFCASPLGHVVPAVKFTWDDSDDWSIAPKDLLRSPVEDHVFQHSENKLAARMMKSDDSPMPPQHDQSDLPKSFWKRLIPDSVLQCFGVKGLKSRENAQPGNTEIPKQEKKKGFFAKKSKEKKNYSPPTWYVSSPDPGSDSTGYVYFPKNSGLGVYRRGSYFSLQSYGKDSVETTSSLSVVRFG